MFDLAIVSDQRGGHDFIFQVECPFTIFGHVEQEGGDVFGVQLGGMDGNVGGVVDVAQNGDARSEEHTSELQSRPHLVCRLLLEKKKKTQIASVIKRQKRT